MSEHLLLVTVGPVQEFIAQARRTRDLWYGSHLLSELGRAAARSLAAGGARLVFPALDAGDPELEPCFAPLRENGQPPLNIPNKLLAAVPPGVDPAQLARAVRDSVLEHWRDGIAAPVKKKCRGVLAPRIEEIWAEQINTLVEVLATWAPLNEYSETRRAVEGAIAGRKNLRDFSPWRQARGGVPKSSLDGGRETVLRVPGERDRQLARKYRIPDGEQLDAVALVKRAGGEPDQFVPVINIALSNWIEVAGSTCAPEIGNLRKACREAGISRVERRDLCWTGQFPFDASILLQSRWGDVFEEQGIEGNAQSWGRTYVGPLLNNMSEPYPYVACLAADGDRMGRALDRLPSAEEHRRLSRALSNFAAQTRTIVEQNYHGALIYSGGDDVLAFLPLSEAMSCAGELRRAFESEISPACGSLPAGLRPTLSAGIGIGHVMQGMGDLLDLGREAEREAKRQRNSLAVLVETRSGGRRTWCARWEEDPAGALRRSVTYIEHSLSTRKVYEIASIVRRLPADSSDPRWARILAREIERAVSRVGEGGLNPSEVGLDLNDNDNYGDLLMRVSSWVNRVLIARVLARSVPRPRSKTNEAAA
ncbi:MAG TPA: type III-B CRISPR-associated protein Cas10/Cmr2 [Bryobacteraceae bacterium]|jgi:CRISPR-associated protein Cmr2|nr:type III-B CRISPR-associated protein Cas10/Cmr2 [Bryobacteraceae bacterium]